MAHGTGSTSTPPPATPATPAAASAPPSAPTIVVNSWYRRIPWPRWNFLEWILTVLLAISLLDLIIQVVGLIVLSIAAAFSFITGGRRGWIVRLFNWLFVGTPAVGGTPAVPGALVRGTRAASNFIFWCLVGVAAGLALFAIAFGIGIYMHYWMFVAAMLALLGIFSFLFFRAVNLVPGTWIWGLPGRMTRALSTLALGLFFLSILALAGPDVLPTLTFKTWLLLGLLCFVLSATGTMAGTSGRFGRFVMKWGSIGLVAAVLIPQLFDWHTSPVLVASREVMVAVRDRSASELLHLAQTTQPPTPARLSQVNESASRKITNDEIDRYQNRVDALLAISATRSLTDAELKEMNEKSVKIKELKAKLDAVDVPPPPATLASVNCDAEKGIIGNEIKRYQNRANALVTISATRSLTDGEVTALQINTEKIKELQSKLQNLCAPAPPPPTPPVVVATVLPPVAVPTVSAPPTAPPQIAVSVPAQTCELASETVSASTPQITLTVESNTPFAFYWVDQTCREVLYTPAGGVTAWTQPTYPGHVWIAKDARTGQKIKTIKSYRSEDERL